MHAILAFPEAQAAARPEWQRLGAYLSENRWELLEDDRPGARGFHGSASRAHPCRRRFRAGPGGLLRLGLGSGPVQVVVGAPASTGEEFVAQLERYVRLVSREPARVSILFEPERQGFRMDPVRTLGLGIRTTHWTSICLHFASPPLGMLMATNAYLWMRDGAHTSFARLHAAGEPACIFCRYARRRHARPTAQPMDADPFVDGIAGVFLEAG